MNGTTALLTFSIGPVHTFIEQARRLADQWSGSQILSHLVQTAIDALNTAGGETVFPYVRKGERPAGLPNRFVCRVPIDRADDVAGAMKMAVLGEWVELTKRTIKALPAALVPPPGEWPAFDADRQLAYASRTMEVAWSWVPEDGDYAKAARAGAEQFAASRMFRPFAPSEVQGEKCAICGERTALPDGDRTNVRVGWEQAEDAVDDPKLKAYFRKDQGRLCLVCTTKRLFPYQPGVEPPHFPPFEAFEPKPDGTDPRPYVAVVKMDGDRMGHVLGWGEERITGGVDRFHVAVSETLTRFADGLRSSPAVGLLNLAALERHLGGYAVAGPPPALVYAGGEDVLFVCDPRDALPIALGIRAKYCDDFKKSVSTFLTAEDLRRLTVSAAICIVHTKHPAGLTFRDAEDLLKHVAKARERRDAVAIRLAKRGGAPVEVAFKWDQATRDGRTWVERLNDLVASLHDGEIASRQSFNLAEDEATLGEVFDNEEQWSRWLVERFSRGLGSSVHAERLAALVAPFFVERRTEALRIARFLGREVT